MSELAERECVPCRGGVPPLAAGEIRELLSKLQSDWKVVEEHHLVRRYKFKNFRAAAEFVMRVGDLAEQQGHHPDISFGWGYAEIKIWTHKINGLTESDFILAAKIEKLCD